MKTMKVNVRGETKFCVVVETGEYDQYNKPKIKRLPIILLPTRYKKLYLLATHTMSFGQLGESK